MISIDTFQLPHQSYLADQLSNAYDCYLEILRSVDQAVVHALGRTDSWETQNVCPPCLYKVENEPPLKFNFLAAMDGNNSLKLIDSAFRAGSVRTDTRSSASRRWISPEEVDTFKDEVKKVCFYLRYFSLSLIDHVTAATLPKITRSTTLCTSPPKHFHPTNSCGATSRYSF